jgi:hypothetical protein
LANRDGEEIIATPLFQGEVSTMLVEDDFDSAFNQQADLIMKRFKRMGQ